MDSGGESTVQKEPVMLGQFSWGGVVLQYNDNIVLQYNNKVVLQYNKTNNVTRPSLLGFSTASIQRQFCINSNVPQPVNEGNTWRL